MLGYLLILRFFFLLFLCVIVILPPFSLLSYNPYDGPNEHPEAELPLVAGKYLYVYGDMDDDGFYEGNPHLISLFFNHVKVFMQFYFGNEWLGLYL